MEEEMLNTENLNISPAFIDTLVMYSTDTTPCCHNLVVLITHHALYMTSPLFLKHESELGLKLIIKAHQK